MADSSHLVRIVPCRKQQPSSSVQHEPNSASRKSDHNSAVLCTHEEQTIPDESLEQRGHHGADDVSQGPARNSARHVEQYNTTAQQKKKMKKRSASQTDDGTVPCQEAADSMQTGSEATSNVGSKASKRQRPDNRARGKLKV